MKRARQTAEIISKKVKAPIEYWEDLHEFRVPSEIKNKQIDDKETLRIKEIIKAHESEKNWKYSDEESFEELNERIRRVIEHLERHHSDETILCVSHSTAIKAIVAKMVFAENLTPTIFRTMREKLWMRNTGVTICEKTDEYGWTLATWSDTTHLGSSIG